MHMFIVSLFFIICGVINAQDYSNNESVRLLQEYVQINTITNTNLDDAVAFWTRLASEVNVAINIQEFTPGYPVIVLTWPGRDRSLSGIMLNSHMDVVPASEEEGWNYPPFSGELDSNGIIWGRGTHDMKSVGIQYYEALKNLAANESTLLRNVYMTLIPDEEVSSVNGMLKFLPSELFKSLNIGFELDEGGSYELPVVPLLYQDKVVWQIQVDCNGIGGHGSGLPAINTTAIGKCLNVMNLMQQFRQEEYINSLTAPFTNPGVYTSVNLNVIRGGSAINVIPSVMSLIYDIRLGTTVNADRFQEEVIKNTAARAGSANKGDDVACVAPSGTGSEQSDPRPVTVATSLYGHTKRNNSFILEDLIHSAGDNITITYISKNEQSPATLTNASNPYLVALNQAAAAVNITLLPAVPPASTDARYVRDAQIPAFGISPMPNTRMLMHSVNERLSASTFLNGIKFYEHAIQNLANLASHVVSSNPGDYIVDTQED